MAGLTLTDVTKTYGTFRALEPLSITVADGEFLAVLGPSGCGKTTLLRVIAGFEPVDGGVVAIGGTPVSSPSRHVPPEDRRVGIVFQSYALWPHMNVAENVAYGLKVAKVSASERTRRVDEALAVVGLTGFGDRRPALLSGGQRQRVALARCLVLRPSLVLLDEPLANLDVHLRASMEQEFRDFHRRTGTTMVYITHDQAEAMALADRIAVLDHGHLMQIATPSTLYREPATDMVARFIGEGLVTPVDVLAVNGARCTVSLYGLPVEARCRPDQNVGFARLCLRARDLDLAGSGGGFAGRVRSVVYQGGFFAVDVAPESAPDEALTLHVPEPLTLAPGEAVRLTVKPGDPWIIPQGAG